MIFDSIPNKLRMAVDVDIAGNGTFHDRLLEIPQRRASGSTKKQALTALSSPESELIDLQASFA